MGIAQGDRPDLSLTGARNSLCPLQQVVATGMPVAIASTVAVPSPRPGSGKQDITGIVEVREVIVGQFAVQICRVADAGQLHLAQLGQIVLIGIAGKGHHVKAVGLQYQLRRAVVAERPAAVE